MLNDNRKCWEVEYLPARGWCVIDQERARRELEPDYPWPPAAEGRTPGMVACGYETQAEAQNAIDDLTAMFWTRLHSLLACDYETDPWESQRIALLFEDEINPEMAAQIRVEANADIELARTLTQAFKLSLEAKRAFDHWVWISTPEGLAEYEREIDEFNEEGRRRAAAYAAAYAALSPEERAAHDAEFEAKRASGEIPF